MNSVEANQRLRAALKLELQRNFGRLGEVEKELGRSEGYLRKFVRGEISVPIDVLLRSLELLNAHPGRFFGRALGTTQAPAATMRGLAGEEPDKALQQIQKAIDAIALACDPEACARLSHDTFAETYSDVGSKEKNLVEGILECSTREHRRRLKTAKRYRKLGFLRLYNQRLMPICYQEPKTATKLAETLIDDLIPQISDARPEDLLVQSVKALLVWGFASRMIDQVGQACLAAALALRLTARFHLNGLEAESLRLAAYLLSDEACFDEALQFLGNAVVIFDELDQDVNAAKTQVQRGQVFSSMGNTNAAIRALKKSLRRLPEADPAVARYRTSAYGSLAQAERMAGNLQAGEEWLNLYLSELDADSGDFTRAKVLFEKGNLHYEKGELAAAEQCLVESRDLLFACESPDAVLVCLDLTRVWLDQHRFHEAIELAESMARLLSQFRKNKLKEAALLKYIRAAGEGRLSIQLVESLQQTMAGRQASRKKS